MPHSLVVSNVFCLSSSLLAWLDELICRHGTFKPSSDFLALTEEHASQADAAPGELLRVRTAVLRSIERYCCLVNSNSPPEQLHSTCRALAYKC